MSRARQVDGVTVSDYITMNNLTEKNRKWEETCSRQGSFTLRTHKVGQMFWTPEPGPVCLCLKPPSGTRRRGCFLLLSNEADFQAAAAEKHRGEKKQTRSVSQARRRRHFQRIWAPNCSCNLWRAGGASTAKLLQAPRFFFGATPAPTH